MILSVTRSVPNLAGRRTYTRDYHPSGFCHCLDKIMRAETDDWFRSYLYYSFQPLFDALVENRVPKELRKQAVLLMEHITAFSGEWLSGYYTGSTMPDRARLEALRPLFEAIDGKVSYVAKDRNIGLYDMDGRNLCVPAHVQTFCLNTLAAVDEAKIPRPDYIIGCACGSSELVMVLAHLLGVRLDFIRRSKRRYDAEPRTITEHVRRIKARAKDKTVLVVEDFVCTGRSLHAVMEHMEKKCQPKQVVGLCMVTNDGYTRTSDLKQIHLMGKEHIAYAFEITK